MCQGQVYQLPTDAEGYTYRLAMCDEIPKAQLPSGCQQYAEHPSVVKYNADNPADCIEIGGTGPCSQGECGMFGTAHTGGGDTELQVTYVYTYGCKNTFQITLTPRSAPARPSLSGSGRGRGGAGGGWCRARAGVARGSHAHG